MQRKSFQDKNTLIIILAAIIVLVVAVSFILYGRMQGFSVKKVPRTVASKLRVHTRKADILITGVNYDEKLKKTKSTIKFIEYGTSGKALEPVHFDFDGNVIQIQSLVMKFENPNFKDSESFRGRSAYIFWKIYLPEGKLTKKIELTKINSVPLAYKLGIEENPDEEAIWKNLWEHVLSPEKPDNIIIKNLQIKAPDKIFIPGTIYEVTLKNDGNMKLNASFLPNNPNQK